MCYFHDKMNVLLRIILSIFLLLTTTLPVFERQLSDIESAEDLVESYLNDLTGGAYDYVKEGAQMLEKSIKSEQIANQENEFDNVLLNGWGYGISTIGAVKMAYGNFRYDVYRPIPILGFSIIIMTLVQVVFLPKFYENGNGILGLINILLVLAILGNTIKDENYDGVLSGAIIFILVQSAYLTIFFIKKGKIKAQRRESLEL